MAHLESMHGYITVHGFTSASSSVARLTGLVPFVALELGALSLFLCLHLGRVRVTEVRRLRDLANLDLTLLEWRALEPLDRLVLRLRLDQPKAGDQLFGLGERSVDDAPLGAV